MIKAAFTAALIVFYERPHRLFFASTFRFAQKLHTFLRTETLSRRPIFLYNRRQKANHPPVRKEYP